jgi:hypothetical protein
VRDFGLGAERHCTHPGAQLAIVTPHWLIEVLQGIVVQSGRVQATQVPELLQLWPVGQVPQETVPPQPSLTLPQSRLPQAVPPSSGAQHAPLWHAGARAPQVFGHWTLPPQPSGTVPHMTAEQAVPPSSGEQH